MKLLFLFLSVLLAVAAGEEVSRELQYTTFDELCDEVCFGDVDRLEDLGYLYLNELLLALDIATVSDLEDECNCVVTSNRAGKVDI